MNHFSVFKILSFTLLLFAAVNVRAITNPINITFDSWHDKTQATRVVTAEELMERLNSKQEAGLDKAYINNITNANHIYYAGNEYNQSTAGIIMRTESESDPAGIAFEFKPTAQVRPTYVGVYIRNTNLPKEYQIRISLNGETTANVANGPFDNGKLILFSTPVTKGEVLREAKIEFMRPSEATETNFQIIVEALDIWFENADNKQTTVTSLKFDADSHVAYLDEADNYVLPTLTAIPADAAKGVTLTSENPEVATVIGTRVIPQSTGTTKITAEIPADHVIFKPIEGLAPTSYNLTVEQSKGSSTDVITLQPDNNLPIRIYDLQGREVTGNPAPGLYILRSGEKSEKILIR